MSGIENGPTEVLEKRLRLGAGFPETERPRVLKALATLESHLSGWKPDRIDLEVSVKDRDGPDQKVTLQAWLAGWPHFVAVSHDRDLDHALTEARKDLIRQIEDERSRREPHKGRATRNRTI
jgi:ribosome-associated translation inhibitor RaiA